MMRSPTSRTLSQPRVEVFGISVGAGVLGMILGRFGGWMLLRILIATFTQSGSTVAWQSVHRMFTQSREWEWSLWSGLAVGVVLAILPQGRLGPRLGVAVGTGLLWANAPLVGLALSRNYRFDPFDLLDSCFVILGASLAVVIEQLWRRRIRGGSGD